MTFLPLLLQTTGLDSLNTAQETGGVTEMTKTVKVWDLIVGVDPITGEVSITNLIVMIALLALSIVSVYIFVERFLSINKSLKEEKDFMVRVKDYLLDGKIDQARDLCAQTDNPAARMVEKGISRIGKPMRDIVSSIENVGKLEIYHLEKRMSFLATASGAAPMIGFLGTTLGMIRVFQAMKFQQNFDLSTISGGIMEAMVTTVAGLVVGIMAYMTYNYLVAKIDKVIHSMENASIEFLDLLNEPGK
ncbi:MotA/TolQ/ExbB proton channel family protein [Paracrocinitomix mangrovi]|uniref:MotA/TolQ/ExbB proton channel family protein n=1 Tax=Paracrocinitomix mangrovi TaxID=2862509 RepID=UPI001C8DCCD0|nr:MotA/TolQ/ExbB proton channel family protein [Paracrocinitomix mangrovi]UKN03214.1 MotA/TolQ/ExbB proton channel family protein [Paracrocinitomix mangrovi]